jgi:hypothetical protein
LLVFYSSVAFLMPTDQAIDFIIILYQGEKSLIADPAPAHQNGAFWRRYGNPGPYGPKMMHSGGCGFQKRLSPQMNANTRKYTQIKAKA